MGWGRGGAGRRICSSYRMTSSHMTRLPAGDPEKWQGAVDVLVGNSVNLMHSIGDLIKDAQVAAVKSRTRTRDGECCG